MTLKIYISGIVLATILSGAAFFLILGFFSPDDADIYLLSLLFFSLFIFLSGLFSLVGFYFRKRNNKIQPAFNFVGISFRQGMLLALLLTGCLALRTYQFFWWWSGLILLILICLIEFNFLRRE